MTKMGDTRTCSRCGTGTMTLTMAHVPEFVIDESKPASTVMKPYPAWVPEKPVEFVVPAGTPGHG